MSGRNKLGTASRSTKYRLRKRQQAKEPEEEPEVAIIPEIENGDNANLNFVERAEFENAFREVDTDVNALPPDILYLGSQITLTESSLLIWMFALKHKLSRVAKDELLQLLNFHLPKGITVATSHYLMQKFVDKKPVTFSTVYYCKQCQNPLDSNNLHCSDCTLWFDKSELDSACAYYIYFDPKMLISACLKDDEVALCLKNNLNDRAVKCGSKWPKKDICDGDEYLKLHLAQHDLSATMNTDGVSPFKSSNNSLYPVFISINELSYKLRRKHTLLLGLWYGCNKPNFDKFLQPIVQAMQELSETRLQWNCGADIFFSRVFVPIFVADSVARCVLIGINQFNGRYGCPWCLIPGCALQDTGCHKWIYPYSRIPHPQRTHVNFIQHANEYAHQLQNNAKAKPVFGVKNASQLLLLPKFDIVTGNVYDIMHSAFLGVTRMFTFLWFDSCNSDCAYYIGTKILQVDSLIKRFKVPSEQNRYFRSLVQRRQWKASEWKIWTFICTIVLENILPQAYLKHFLLYTNAIMLLNDDSISASDIDYAEQSLRKFVSLTQNLYGTSNCSFNLHLLLHACDCVKNWGPLWAYSTFQFEHFNGVISKLFKGSHAVPKQVANRVVEFQNILGRSREPNAFVNPESKAFFETCMEGKNFFANWTRCTNNVMFLGPSLVYSFTENQKKLLCSLGLVPANSALQFRRFCVNGKIFASEVTKHRANCIGVFEENNTYMLTNLLCVENYGEKIGIAVARKMRLDADPHRSYVSLVRKVGRECFVLLRNIQLKKFIVMCDVNDRFTKLVRVPNTSECE